MQGGGNALVYSGCGVHAAIYILGGRDSLILAAGGASDKAGVQLPLS